MGTILIVDDTPFWRDIASDTLRRRGYSTVTVGNGLEALAALEGGGTDMVILDVEMPHLQGLSFLEQIRLKPQWKSLPVIMLTGDMHKDHILLAKKLGVADYILKGRFSPPELLSRVERGLGAKAKAAIAHAAPATALAPRVSPAEAPVKAAPVNTAATGAHPAAAHEPELAHLLDRERALRRVQKVMHGQALSMVVTQVISAATSQRGDLSELSALISRDPVLASRVLHAANHAAQSTGRPGVTTLDEAVRLVGCSTIRDIASSLGIIDAMPAPDGDGYDPIRSWQHSLAVATLCGKLAPSESAGTAYLVGLCHDLGEILFRTHFSEEYEKVLKIHAVSAKPLHTLETVMLGITHGELVSQILSCMGLPDCITRPITEYHEVMRLNSVARDRMARTLQMADLYANGMMLATSRKSPVRPLSRAECRSAIGEEDPPRPDDGRLRSEIQTMTALYSRKSAGRQGDMTQPLCARRAVRLCVVREPSLSGFDPVSVALEGMAEVRIDEILPDPVDLADFKGLVVLSRTAGISRYSADDIQTARSGIKPIPVLWLIGRGGAAAPANADAPKPTQWPATLESLEKFVESLG